LSVEVKGVVPAVVGEAPDIVALEEEAEAGPPGPRSAEE